MTVTVVKNGMPALLAAIKMLDSTRVMIGIPSDAEQPHLCTAPIGTEKRKDDPIGNATIYYINAVSLIQAITPRPMLGRANASLRFLGLASVLAGQLVAGVAGGVIGLRATIAIGAAGLWVTAAILAVSVVGSVGEISGTPEVQVEAGS